MSRTLVHHRFDLAPRVRDRAFGDGDRHDAEASETNRGWTALVYFAADETKVVTVFETPTDGIELVGDFPKGWIARDVKFREGEFEGKDFQLELRAERSE